MSARVLEFPTIPLTDEAAHLRRLADRIERGEIEGFRFIVFVISTVEGVEVAMLGHGTPLEALGALTAAQHEVLT